MAQCNLLFLVSRIIGSQHSIANVRWLIQVKQEGGCRYCRQAFGDTDQIVSTGQKKKYYHRHCAEKLNII